MAAVAKVDVAVAADGPLAEAFQPAQRLQLERTHLVGQLGERALRGQRSILRPATGMCGCAPARTRAALTNFVTCRRRSTQLGCEYRPDSSAAVQSSRRRPAESWHAFRS